MSKQIESNRFIDSSMPRFYQHLFKGIDSFKELGNRIIRQIKAAHAFRQIEQARELSRLLLNIPIKEYQLIGQYYIYWCRYRNREYDIASLETIIDHTHTYKAQALLSRGTLEYDNRRNLEAFYFYSEALKARPNISEYIAISRAIAVAKAVDGFHNLALNDLEKLLPIIKHAEPRLYFDYLNSYAVELAELGRKSEARNIIRAVVASPFAPYYPEWQETARDLREPNRSFVAVPLIKREHVKIEKTETRHASKPEPPTKVIPFKLKEASQPQKPDKLSPQEYAEMTTGDKRELILAAVKSGAISEDDYYKMMIMLGLVSFGPSDKVLDLEDDQTIDDIGVIWANHVGSEELAAVLSALRDCEDRARRNGIIDRLIKIAFQQSHRTRMSEEAWRLEVERRLPEK